MKTNHKSIIFIFSWILLIFTGCITTISPSPVGQTSEPLLIPTPKPLPKYIESIGPKGIINKSDYDNTLMLKSPIGRGIRITVNGAELGIREENINLDYIWPRIVVFADNEPLSSEIASKGDGLMPHGPYYLGWAVELEPGMHTVRFMFTRDSGEILEYSWQFYLTEK